MPPATYRPPASGALLRSAPLRPALRRAANALLGGHAVVVRLDGRDPVLMCAARDVRVETVAFMVRHTSGFLCVALPAHRADELELPPMHHLSEGAFEVAYGVSVDADEGIDTGISARDRALTIGLLGDPSSSATQFRRPGHVITLRARPAGLHARLGFTEAAVDLASLAGLPPAMAMAELVSTRSPDAMMPEAEVADFCQAHGLVSITVAEIAAAREATEPQLRAAGSRTVLARGTSYEVSSFAAVSGDRSYLAVVPTGVAAAGPYFLLDDCPAALLDPAAGCGCAAAVPDALARIADWSSGVLIIARGGPGECSQDASMTGEQGWQVLGEATESASAVPGWVSVRDEIAAQLGAAPDPSRTFHWSAPAPAG